MPENAPPEMKKTPNDKWEVSNNISLYVILLTKHFLIISQERTPEIELRKRSVELIVFRK